MKRNVFVVFVVVSWIALAAACAAPPQADPEAGADPSVARTREQVKMLDDLYKTAVVLITEHYVETPSTLSAASAPRLCSGKWTRRVGTRSGWSG